MPTNYDAGITPAYAGNTLLFTKRLDGLRDHPRLRGKHGYYAMFEYLNGGSPPLTRETHRSMSNLVEILGITPAYAGNTPEI